MIGPILKKLAQKKSLTEEEVRFAFEKMMSGELADSQAASFLTAIEIIGLSDEDVIFALEEIRKISIKISPKAERLVDTCGTGGDNSGTFNISTVAAFVAAGAGVNVAKHGNRSNSSKCGSADVLESLGVNLNIGPSKAEKMLEEIGICFLFAPIYHPGFKNVAKIRKELGFKTIFNFLGPLCNSANVKRQVIGVYDQELTERIANILRKIGSEHILVVNGGGMDEISISEKTKITELKDGEIKTYYIDPKELGFFNQEEGLSGGTIEDNKRIMQEVLEGSKSSRRDAVALNAAAAIYVSGKTDSIKSAIVLAEKSIDSGAALKKLNDLIQVSNI